MCVIIVIISISYHFLCQYFDPPSFMITFVPHTFPTSHVKRAHLQDALGLMSTTVKPRWNLGWPLSQDSLTADSGVEGKICEVQDAQDYKIKRSTWLNKSTQVFPFVQYIYILQSWLHFLQFCNRRVKHPLKHVIYLVSLHAQVFLWLGLLGQSCSAEASISPGLVADWNKEPWLKLNQDKYVLPIPLNPLPPLLLSYWVPKKRWERIWWWRWWWCLDVFWALQATLPGYQVGSSICRTILIWLSCHMIASGLEKWLKRVG